MYIDRMCVLILYIVGLHFEHLLTSPINAAKR